MSDAEICLICGKPHHGAIRGGKVSRLTSCYRLTSLQRKAKRREVRAATLRLSQERAREWVAEVPTCRCGVLLTEAHARSCRVWLALLEGAAKGATLVCGKDMSDGGPDYYP